MIVLTSVIETEKVVCEGKTKIGREATSAGTDKPLVVFEAKHAITAHNDPSFTRQMASKPVAATTTTCRIFELLQKAAIPVAYIGQVSETKFAALRCQMIALECIVRRYAVGSALKRFPELNTHVLNRPHEFSPPGMELFLKTSNGAFTTVAGDVIDLGFERTPQAPITEGTAFDTGDFTLTFWHLPPLVDVDLDDPFILNPEDKTWILRHPKKRMDDPAGAIEKTIQATDVLPPGVTVDQLFMIMNHTFILLEKYWAQLDCRLIDFKIEFGVLPNGTLVVADVIDNDSWRLWGPDGKELSKELFRQGGEMGEVQQAYERVAELALQLGK